MKVLLVDVDSKIPNLALMQISAYWKERGAKVGFGIDDPDLIYVSCIFKKNAWKMNGIMFRFPHVSSAFGGSGFSYNWLPEMMRKVKPDYDLYDMDYSLGFTTRGCIRKCPFCIVKDKEGEYQRWQPIEDFLDDRFKKVQLLDNNWYADKEWFMRNSQVIIDRGLKVIENGMDIRILDEEIAQRLKELKWGGKLHFAWDNMNDEKAVLRGIKLLKDAGINTRSNVYIYVLVGYNTTPIQDLKRCRIIKEQNCNAFVMPFKKTKWTHAIGRWADRPETFWSMDFENYEYGNWTHNDYIRIIEKGVHV